MQGCQQDRKGGMMSEKPISRMYVLVRQDITPGYQIAQSIHAKDQFTHEYPEVENKWYNESNTIVVLGVSDEHALKAFAFLAESQGLKHSMFYEPDIDEYTALAIEPGEATANLCSRLKTASKGYQKITS